MKKLICSLFGVLLIFVGCSMILVTFLGFTKNVPDNQKIRQTRIFAFQTKTTYYSINICFAIVMCIFGVCLIISVIVNSTWFARMLSYFIIMFIIIDFSFMIYFIVYFIKFETYNSADFANIAIWEEVVCCFMNSECIRH